jgi:type II pantothenate kinase
LALTGGKAGKLRELLAESKHESERKNKRKSERKDDNERENENESRRKSERESRRKSERESDNDREIVLVPEFEATCAGAAWMLERDGRRPDAFLLTNVGTGTSIHYVTRTGHERVGGTGVGGGTILGLSMLLGGSGDFTSITTEAQRGNRANVDLKVSHIYSGMTPPIPGDLTASNFGNVIHQTAPIEKADALASVIGLVGETVTTVSVHAAREKGTANIVYIGSTFVENALLADIVMRYTRLRGGEPCVLPDGGFSGAIGALLTIR